VPEVLRRGYLTPDVAPVACELRATPEDFRVDEVPLYEPAGEGEHVYLRVEKRGISTAEAVRRISRRLRVPPRAIGHAGLKDARAVTVQTLSIHLLGREVEPGSLDDANLRVVDARRHKNKLKVGHLAGNRFTLRLRGGAAGEREARLVLERLAARGVANYFGLQRFGFERTTQRLGEALVREDPTAFVDWLLLGAPDAAPAPAPDEVAADDVAEGEDAEPTADGEGDDAPPPPVRGRDARAVALAREKLRAGELREAQRLLPRSFQAEHSALRARIEKRDPAACVRAVPASWRSFYVAAFQALLFNAYLNRRLERVDQLEAGEVATLHRNGASFLVVDAAAEQARCATFELSPSGPLFGHKLLRPAEGSSARADEDAVLAALAPGLTAELTQALGARPRGERRPLRIPLRDPTVEVEGEDLRVGFFLPRGSYATAVIEELRKQQTD
jgi:tRNA pseudouridine13 synthase